MDKKTAQKLIEDTFNSSFSEDKFTIFAINLLNDLEQGEKVKSYSGNYIWDDFKEHINSYKRIGKYIDPKGEALDVLIVEVKSVSKLERARTTLRNFVIKHLSRFEKDYALVAFYSKEDNGDDWRFSFIKLEYRSEIDETKGKVKIRTEFTPAKRYSFLVGKYEKTYTAKNQLLPLLQNISNNPTIEELEAAFSIEKITDEFFDQYKDLYIKIYEYFESDSHALAELEKAGIDNARFTKKLLGQIAFLYFLQKKGWLGVAKNKCWGTGDKRFVQHLFEGAQNEGVNFFKDKLQYLFYEALAKERDNVNSYYKRFECRIPFLNGGLFEANYDWENANISIPRKFFRNEEINKSGDIGTGVLDVFDRYNFTIKEDEPLDKEVAVDPEMLGKVFENMLDIIERKNKGAFYTPREIVHYMCQESLIHYLDNSLNDYTESYQELGDSQTSLFRNTGKKGQYSINRSFQNIKVPKSEIETFIREGHFALENDTRVAIKGETKTYRYQLPECIRQNADLIDQKLSDIRICDPAIGSGAFPLGLLHELVNAMLVLKPHLSYNYLTKKLKSFGFENWETVNNGRYTYRLKRHIIQESIYGVDIDASAIDIARLRLWLSLVVDEDNIDPIETLPNLDYKIVCGNSLIGLPEFAMKDLKVEKELEGFKEKFYSITDEKEKKVLREKINNKIRELLNSAEQFTGYKIDFDFKLFFSEVWREKGGFDVVIGNPPYISTKGISNTEKKSYEAEFGFSDDTYNLFTFKGLKLTKNNGSLTYIIPKTFWTIQTKRKMRELILNNSIRYIFDTANPFNSVMVDTCIMQVVKQPYTKNHKINFLDGSKNFKEPEIFSPIAQKVYRETQNFVIFKPTEYNLKIYNLYGKKVKKLYDQWWDKIETSKKIAQNTRQLEEYRANLRPGDIALLGCLTEGGQGLATANNGKYIAVRKSTKWADNIKKSRPKKLIDVANKFKISNNEFEGLSPSEFLTNRNEEDIAKKFDQLKEKYGRDIFGQGYIYRLIDDEELADVDSLTNDEKENGIDTSKKIYVPYDKGDKDGNRWYLETPFAIAWSKENVRFLKTDPKARYQGYTFYFREGFCWNNVLTTFIRCKIKQKTVQSTESMSFFSVLESVPEYYMITVMNSSFAAYYIDSFVNSTSHCTTGDAKLLPILIPSKEELDVCKYLFDKIIRLKKSIEHSTTQKKIITDINLIEKELDKFVRELYGV